MSLFHAKIRPSLGTKVCKQSTFYWAAYYIYLNGTLMLHLQSNSFGTLIRLPLIEDEVATSILVDFETSKMVYKSLNALAPDYLRNIFQKVSEATNRPLRNSKTDLRLPLLRTSTGQKSFAYRGARIWSDLDSVVKESASFSSFRRNYKTKL